MSSSSSLSSITVVALECGRLLRWGRPVALAARQSQRGCCVDIQRFTRGRKLPGHVDVFPVTATTAVAANYCSSSSRSRRRRAEAEKGLRQSGRMHTDGREPQSSGMMRTTAATAAAAVAAVAGGIVVAASMKKDSDDSPAYSSDDVQLEKMSNIVYETQDNFVEIHSKWVGVSGGGGIVRQLIGLLHEELQLPHVKLYVSSDIMNIQDSVPPHWIDVTLYKGQRRQKLRLPVVTVANADLGQQSAPTRLYQKKTSSTSAFSRPFEFISRLGKRLEASMRRVPPCIDIADKTTQNVMDEVRRFFMPVSETLLDANQLANEAAAVAAVRGGGSSSSSSSSVSVPVKQVTYNSFRSEALEVSSPSHLVLLQLQEDSCFLCFLMRPFLTSLNTLLHQAKIPLTIMRLNIERNDFPDELPVSRATPSFVLLRGPERTPEVWSEFRPSEVLKKIEQTVDLPDELRLRLSTRMVDQVPRRMAACAQLANWMVNSSTLQQQLGGALAFGVRLDGSGSGSTQTTESEAAPRDGIPLEASPDVMTFQKSLLSVIEADMTNSSASIELIDENISLLEGSIKSCMKDCVVFCQMISEVTSTLGRKIAEGAAAEIAVAVDGRAAAVTQAEKP